MQQPPPPKRPPDAASLPYHELFLLAPVAACITRRSDGKVIDVNAAWEALSGIARADALGRTTIELGHWADEREREQALQQLPGSMAPMRVRFRGGEPQLLRMHGAVLGEGPDALLLIQIAQAEREVLAEAARAQSELALASSHRELQQRVELHAVIEATARVGHWTNAEDDQAVVWSPGLYAITGRARGTRQTREQVRQGIHPEDREAWLAARQRRDGSELEFRWLHPDGQTRWFRTRMGQTLVKGKPQTDFGVVQDVSASRFEADRHQRLMRMLAAITEAQSVFIEAEDKRRAFEGLLQAFLKVTGSGYGFLGEVLYDAQDRPYMRTHAMTDITWDEASRLAFAAHADAGMEFHKLDTLFGHAMRTGEVVIANDPRRDSRAGGMPVGHAPLDAFLGIPLAVGERLVAMVGLANQPGGYSEADVSFLQPLLGALRQLVLAWRHHGERQRTSAQLEATTALLAEKSRALQVTLDSISQGLVTLDLEGRVSVYNRRCLELLDLPDALLRARPLQDEVLAFQTRRGDFGPSLDWLDPQARPRIAQEPGAQLPDHFWRRTREGRTLEIRTLRFPQGGLVRTFADVTPYIQAQEALRDERQRLAWVLEGTRPGIWESNLNDGSMRINERWAEMLGHSCAELEPVSHATWATRLHPEDRLRAFEARERHLTGEAPYYECDLRLRHKDGHWVWVNTRGRVHQRDQQDRAVYMSGTHLDISERVAAQEQIRALNAGLEQRVRERTAELERSMRDMEAISYSIAHDLRAPLRSVNGFAQLLAEEELHRLSEGGREMFLRISRSARNMGQMITDMLELLRVVQVELEPQPVDMGALSHAVAESLGPQAPQVRVSVGDLPAALGDATLLRQVLSNLVDNAMKYSRQRPDARVELGYDCEQQAYFVRDNCMGFDMARADKLFGLFQRLHADSEVPGMGVGLAIVSRIVERHGGRVWAESSPGAGACFWFSLPRG